MVAHVVADNQLKVAKNQAKNEMRGLHFMALASLKKKREREVHKREKSNFQRLQYLEKRISLHSIVRSLPTGSLEKFTKCTW